jgi:chemotaxis protein histidine kinase CheA
MLGVSRQAVGDLVKRGILPEGKDGKIDVDLAKVALADRVRPSGKTAQALAVDPLPPASPPANAPDPNGDKADDVQITSFHVARTLNEAAQAQMNQLKLRQMQGELIEVSAVRGQISAVLSSLREALMQIPARMSPVLAAESDASRVHDALSGEIHQALEQFTALPTKLEAKA